MTPIGIQNRGNTCSVAALLQCMYHVRSLRGAVCSAHFASGSVGESVQQIFQMLAQDAAEDGETRMIVPDGLLVRIANMSDGLFPHGEQHDMCELWCWLLDQLHEASAEERPSPADECKERVESVICKVLHSYQGGRYSNLLDVTQGSQLAIVKCNACGYRAHNIEPFSIVPLEFPEDSESNTELAPMIRHYFSPQPLDDWKCDSCKVTGAERLIQWYHIPRVLVIAISRFQTTEDDEVVKDRRGVLFPESMTLGGDCFLANEEPVTFRLRAVGNHHGASLDGGHYTAVVSDEGGAWHVINDDHVMSWQARHMKMFDTLAYLLFYERDVA
jgi:ubiquitin C-terminal hydrolase